MHKFKEFLHVSTLYYLGPFCLQYCYNTVKPFLSCHSKRTPKLVFKADYRLMQVKSIAEYSKGSILQYFRPSLSYHLSFRALFCLFLSGCIRQILLYMFVTQKHNLIREQTTKVVTGRLRVNILSLFFYPAG